MSAKKLNLNLLRISYSFWDNGIGNLILGTLYKYSELKWKFESEQKTGSNNWDLPHNLAYVYIKLFLYFLKFCYKVPTVYTILTNSLFLILVFFSNNLHNLNNCESIIIGSIHTIGQLKVFDNAVFLKFYI